MPTNLLICRCITWNDVDRFKNVILKPGIVNTVQSFCGCVEPQKVSNCDQLQRALTNLDVWRSDNITLDASKCKVLFITSSTAGTVAQTACLLKRTCPSLTDITAGRTLYAVMLRKGSMVSSSEQESHGPLRELVHQENLSIFNGYHSRAYSLRSYVTQRKYGFQFRTGEPRPTKWILTYALTSTITLIMFLSLIMAVLDTVRSLVLSSKHLCV
jgi:hypothetical protein